MSLIPEIKFGTDGWRGIISRDFTFENLRWVTQAVIDYLKLKNLDSSGLVVGYDRRFLSEEYAREVSAVAAANGVKVFLSNNFAPTPAVSWAVKERGAGGGIMITASHNPAIYNGLKFKENFGGSSLPETTAMLEKLLKERWQANKEPLFEDFDKAVKNKTIVEVDMMESYLNKLRGLVDFEKIKKSGIKVAVDSMFGAGSGCIKTLLSEVGIEVKEIRSEYNPGFDGVSPEPIARNMGQLISIVRDEKYDIGLATDGDADRIGAVDGRGDFFDSHRILTLLIKHLVEERKMKGDIVKTVSSTRMIDLLGEKYGITVHETPIGFKHICKKMLEGDIMIGGEESGGIGISSHIPERDGIFAALLLVEIMAVNGMRLEEVLDELFKEIGHFCYDRVDLKISKDSMNDVRTRLADYHPSVILSLKVTEENRMDGAKFCLENGSWLLIRASGTEPVLRIYAESSSPQKVQELLEEGQRAVGLKK